MSVEQPDVIDGIGIDKVSGKVVLTISDHLPWDEHHLIKLEAKLAGYVRFVESGQILEQCPESRDRDKSILVLLLHRPTDLGGRFLQAALAGLGARGLGFQFGPLPAEGYINDNG
jgi:hypothetical protein